MKQAIGILLVILLPVSFTAEIFVSPVLSSKGKSGNDYECSQEGYVEYLNNWSVDEKSSSRDTTSDEFKQRVQYFIENCLKIHEWNRQDRYKMELNTSDNLW